MRNQVLVAQIRLKTTKEKLCEILQSLGSITCSLCQSRSPLRDVERTLKFPVDFLDMTLSRSGGTEEKATGLLFAFQPSPQKCLLFVYDTAHHVVRTTAFASARHIWK